MKRHHVRFWLGLIGLGLVLAGCGGDNSGTNTLGSDPYLTDGGTPQIFALFDPGPQVMPLPNDVVWMADGDPEVEISADPNDPQMSQLAALVNAQGLLGLSPNMFLTVPVSGAVDPATLDLLVFRTDDPHLGDLLSALATGDLAGAGTALAQMEIRTAADFIVATGPGVLKLLPKTPFTPGAAYAVVVQHTLKDSHGFLVDSSIAMRALKSPEPFDADSPFLSLEALRAAFNDAPPGQPSLFDVVGAVSSMATAAHTPWTRDDVLVLWTFHTADKTLSLTPTTAGADTVPYPAGGVDPFALTGAALKGVNDAFTADTLSWLDLGTGTPVPSATPVGLPATAFLAGAGMSAIPSDQLGNIYFGLFQSPVLTTGTTDSVYFLLTMPDATLHPEPAAGYPVVVFQHGLTRSKEDALAIANSLAQAGFATLAIDAPFHGSRTPEGHVSGDLFLTANLLQDRANLYHAAMDLWETLDVIDAGIDVDGGGADLDAAHIDFMSHSLGSMIGTVFLSQENRAQRMILSSPTALLADTLDETRRTDMQSLVTSLGYTPGTTPYYVFLDILQWLLDPVDGSYNGIGSNSADSLLVNFAYGDPEVSTNSSRVFLANVGISAVASYDPDNVALGIFPAVAPGAYEYGVAGKPVIHTFLLSPEFDLTTEPWYVGGGYSQDVQDEATYAAQMQAAGFLATP